MSRSSLSEDSLPRIPSLQASLPNRDAAPARLHALYVLLVSFLASALLILLTPRTVLGAGLFPRASWYVPLALLSFVALLFPVTGGIRTEGTTWRIAPLCALLLPTPLISLRIGLGLLSVAGALCWFTHPSLRRRAGLLIEMAAAWLLALSIGNIYAYVVVRIKDVPGIAQIVACLFRLSGREVSSEGARVAVLNSGMNYPLLISPDKFALEFALSFLGVVLLLGALHGVPRRARLGAVGVTLAYLVLRAVWYFGMHLTGGEPTGWWDESGILLSFAPLPALIALFWRRHPDRADCCRGCMRDARLALGRFWHSEERRSDDR